MNECEYCRKTYHSISTLNRHLKTCKIKRTQDLENHNQTHIQLLREQYERELQLTKEQLHIQREQYEREIQLAKEQLHIQREQYERLTKEQLHIQREQYERELQLTKEQLNEFKTQIFDIAKQPKNINNHSDTKTTNNNQRTLNMINQLAPMNFNQDQKHLEELFRQEFTEDIFFEGPDGITRLVVENVLVDQESGKFKMICTDASRKHFKYTEEGEVKTDHGMNRLHDLVKKPLANANMMIYLEAIKDVGINTVDRYRNIRERNEEFIKSRHMLSDKIISETNK